MTELIYPHRCPICDRVIPSPRRDKKNRSSRNYCCPECEKKLPWVGEQYCLKCGNPVGEREEFCNSCQKTQHYFEQGRAAFLYQGKLRRAIYLMKVDNRRDYIDFFADSMLKTSWRDLAHWKPEEIIPVPMHSAKKRKRGYNQSELLAGRIHELTGIPLNRNRVVCSKFVPEQKSLDRRERSKNLRGVFSIKSREKMPGSVLLIDDIYTTGSTIDELALLLRRAGVEKVWFLVISTSERKR